MMRDKNSSTILGQVGVHRVIAELLARDIVPCIPVVDVGVDLITSNGVRLQVKSSRLVVPTGHRYKQPVYWFNITKRWTRGRNRSDGKREYGCRTRQFSEECDFVIFWGSDQDRFWIVPARVLDGRSTVVLGGIARWRDVDVEDLRSLRMSGLSYKKIAEKYGLDEMLVWSRLTSHASPKGDHGKLAKEVNACENHWSLIEDFTRTVTTRIETREMVSKEIGG